MAEDEETTDDAPKKASKLPLILGLVLALVGAGGGFFAVQSGLLFKTEVAEEEPESIEISAPEVSFVPLDPMIISLPGDAGRGHLRFVAQLEVVPGFETDIETIKPRITDVLNEYLRAVEVAELEEPTAMWRLRSQMLRRIQVVAGDERVKDLLIMEFVLS